MTVLPLEADRQSDIGLTETLGWWDSDSQCTVVVSRPSLEPDIWDEYVRGAERSYRKHGVERALDRTEIGDGSNTALFFTAVDASGRVVGGLRSKGPYQSADESHAVLEWHGQPGQDAVRKMINDRLPFGVVEMKTAWVTDDPTRNRALIDTLARTAFPAMALLNAQFLMATSSRHVLERWRSSGAVVAPKIPATPYPDERYLTKIMWWDRRTFVNHAEPRQAAKIIAEMTQLNEILSAREHVVGSGSSS